MTDLVKRLRADWPEILVEKHWMMDSDAIEEQRREAADRIEELEAELDRCRMAMAVMDNTVAKLERLYRYAKHKPECIAVMRLSPSCTCGLTALLKEIDGHD